MAPPWFSLLRAGGAMRSLGVHDLMMNDPVPTGVRLGPHSSAGFGTYLELQGR